MVDGDTVGWAPSGPPARPGGAHGRREVCRLPDPARPHTLPGPAGLGAPVALRRGTADRRSNASAHHPRGRSLWSTVAVAERRTAPARGALEIWVQGNQVDRQDRTHGRPADLDVERPGTVRVRVLLERQPEACRTHDGARRPSSESVRAVGGRRSSSMDMPIRSANSIPAWICGPISEPAAMISVGMKRQRP